MQVTNLLSMASQRHLTNQARWFSMHCAGHLIHSWQDEDARQEEEGQASQVRQGGDCGGRPRRPGCCQAPAGGSSRVFVATSPRAQVLPSLPSLATSCICSRLRVRLRLHCHSSPGCGCVVPTAACMESLMLLEGHSASDACRDVAWRQWCWRPGTEWAAGCTATGAVASAGPSTWAPRSSRAPPRTWPRACGRTPLPWSPGAPRACCAKLLKSAHRGSCQCMYACI